MTTETTNAIETAIKQAEQLGKRHGQAVAEMIAQYAWGGRNSSAKDSEQAARDFLRMSEDGDPALWNAYEAPNLSGQYAGDMTPRELIAEVYDGDEMLEPEDGDDICRAYEDGSRDGFWGRLEESAAAVLDH
jgi:hypothetical protein